MKYKLLQSIIHYHPNVLIVIKGPRKTSKKNPDVWQVTEFSLPETWSKGGKRFYQNCTVNRLVSTIAYLSFPAKADLPWKSCPGLLWPIIICFVIIIFCNDSEASYCSTVLISSWALSARTCLCVFVVFLWVLQFPSALEKHPLCLHQLSVWLSAVCSMYVTTNTL